MLPQVMRMTPYDTPAKRAGDAAQPCIDAANFVTIDATVERGCASTPASDSKPDPDTNPTANPDANPNPNPNLKSKPHRNPSRSQLLLHCPRSPSSTAGDTITLSCGAENSESRLVPQRRKWTSVYGSYFGAVEEVLADVRLAIAGVSVDERIRRGTLAPVRRCAAIV